jgi:undecaprenyl-diphosphatase
MAVPEAQVCSKTESTDQTRESALRWALVGFALLLAALLLGVAASGDITVRGDLQVSHTIQRPTLLLLDAIAHAASAIGDTFPGMLVVVFAAVIFLIARGRPDLALFIAVAAALRAFGPVLKTVAASPRPSAETLVVLAEADGFGYPSGHALGAALLYGAIAVVTPEVVSNQVLARGIQVFAVAMIVLIALSRVRLGVHWPTDVLGGVLIGLGLVCLLYSVFLAWQGRAAKT